jgi:carbon-monoxide dehydrogenase large subunit
LTVASTTSTAEAFSKELGEAAKLVGKSLPRVEDFKLVSGKGSFIGDLRLPGALHACFIRSPFARARIKKIDPSAALRSPSVAGVVMPSDLTAVGDMPTVEASRRRKHTPRRPLPNDEVRYVGEAVAAVLAETPEAAQDAAELVNVEYEPMTPVVDPLEALKPESTKVHGHLEDNVAERIVYSSGDTETAFKLCDGVIKLDMVNQRVAPVPLEPRGVAATYDAGAETLTVWATTQDPHGLRSTLSTLLGLPEANIRVIAPDVGGAFGSKISLYPEDVVVCYASMKFMKPVVWIETRRENMACGTHGRGQKQHVELAYTKEGKITGMKITIVSDAGAYATAGALENPELTMRMATGVYHIRNYHAEVISVLTNKVPQDAYRGAGRPEAAYLIERAVDTLARRLNMDPVHVRSINFIPTTSFPYKTAAGYTYDNADYESVLRRLLQISGYPELVKYRDKAKAEGRMVGVGIAVWTEITSFGPGFPQTASITVNSKGEVTIAIGGHPHGQGHKTPMTQIVCDELGITPDQVTVIEGDTGLLPWSSLTAGSRSAALTGSAVLGCARKIKAKMSKVAAHLLGEPAMDFVFMGGKIYPADRPEKSVDFRRVAEACYDGSSLPEGVEPTLFEYTAYSPLNYAFPYGAHLAVVEVDPDTGRVKIEKYYAVDDVGLVLNPMLAEGQVHGGVVQGLGQALMEGVVYDESGQLLTSTLADYTIPSTTDVPRIIWDRLESPTYSNSLGAKGIGEAGTIAATPTIVNAVQDALSSINAFIDQMPLTSEYVCSLMHRTRAPDS